MANTRLLVALAAGVIVLLEVFSTPTRTAPFMALTALPSVTGHCVAPVLAEVMVMGVFGQNASWPVVDTVRTETRSPATSVRGSVVSAPRSCQGVLAAGWCRKERDSLSDELPLVISRLTVTSCAAVGVFRLSVAMALIGFVMVYSAAFGAATLQVYERLLPVEPLPLSW